MTELDELTEELSSSLAAIDKPCGCQDSTASENPFSEFSASDDLEAELAMALESLEDSGVFSDLQLSGNETLELGSLGSHSKEDLADIVSLLEKYPGLKITISF